MSIIFLYFTLYSSFSILPFILLFRSLDKTEVLKYTKVEYISEKANELQNRRL